jgi:hypothetical protein
MPNQRRIIPQNGEKMTPKELAEIIQTAREDLIDKEVEVLDLDKGWIVRRITLYIDKNNKAHVCFNFEVELD